MNQIESNLMRGIADGDRWSIARLYEIYHPRLHRFLTGFVRDPELIAELINDVMMIVWQKAASFRNESRVSTWIFGISYRRAMDEIRRSERYREILGEVPAPVDDGASLNESIVGRDLNLIMSRLSPEQRAVTKLTFEFGYSYPEIAEILQIPVNTVKSRMFYARKAMQEVVRQGEEPR